MTEEQVVVPSPGDIGTTFTIGGQVFEAKIPKGRSGRKATGYFMSKVGLGGTLEQDFTDKIVEIISDDEFERNYLHIFLGVEKSFLEKEGSFMEILQAVIVTFGALTSGMNQPEVDAAIKNSMPTQEAD